MVNRREFLGAIVIPTATAAVAGGVLLSPTRSRRAAAALKHMAAASGSPEAVARDEDLWFEVGQAFAVDRSIINLNNGGVSPSPRSVVSALERHIEFSNNAPAYYMWNVLEPQRETVRDRLATAFGCEKEELALTRNASESLQICQCGLPLQRGDEVLTTTQDYPRMITAFKQLERRAGIALKQFKIPVPCEDPSEIVQLFEKNITPKTRMILVSHVINLTGQIMPVRDVAALGRKHNIPVVVDGAHAIAHLDFKLSDLECDYYGASLHKWLCAPIGTGLLYVRRDKIEGLWPLMASEKKQDADIRKFEEIGTHPAANYLGIAEALTFHQGIGSARKLARLTYLRNYWADRLAKNDRVRLHTSLKPGCASGLGNIQIDGIDTAKLYDWLWREHRIYTTAIIHDEFNGLRISPSIYTQLPELDRFCDKMEIAIKNGLPA